MGVVTYIKEALPAPELGRRLLGGEIIVWRQRPALARLCARADILLREGFEVFVLEDAIRAVNVKPDDGARAQREMQERGAKLVRRAEVAA